VTAEDQRGFRVTSVSVEALGDITRTRIELEGAPPRPFCGATTGACGFPMPGERPASSDELRTIEDLELVVKVARRVWGGP
jgi:hypothetical protein